MDLTNEKLLNELNSVSKEKAAFDVENGKLRQTLETYEKLIFKIQNNLKKDTIDTTTDQYLFNLKLQSDINSLLNNNQSLSLTQQNFVEE